MQAMRASPSAQQRLFSRRYGAKRTLRVSAEFRWEETTSCQVRWQAPQKSTESTRDRFAGLKMRPEPSFSVLAEAAATCFAPGPWQDSQFTPSTALAGSS